MKTLSAFITEGADLRCHNCGDNLGKATENSKNAYCGTCGSTTKNPAGSDETHSRSAPKKVTLGNHPSLKDGIKSSKGKADTTIEIKNLHHKKVIDHGNGVFSVTTKYKQHHAAKSPGFDDSPAFPGVHHAVTTVYHFQPNNKELYPKGWDSTREMGQIHHTKMPSGEEHHTIIHGHGGMTGHNLIGGAAKSIHHGAMEIAKMHHAGLPSDSRKHYDRSNTGRKIGFTEAKK